MEAVWRWFDRLWEAEQVDAPTFHALQDLALPRLRELLTNSEGREQGIVDLVAFLRGIDN